MISILEILDPDSNWSSLIKRNQRINSIKSFMSKSTSSLKLAVCSTKSVKKKDQLNNNSGKRKRKKKKHTVSSSFTPLEYYTATGHYSKSSSRFYYHKNYEQIGTFLTQYKIRENYKFLQMISVPRLDPAVPKPEGGLSVPACGEPLIVPASFPQSIEAAIHKFAIASSKSTCISILDQYGKPASSITYVKLLNRVQRAAYHLLNKLILNTQQHNGEEISLKQGDRVALVFPNNDPIGFTVAFCACLMGGLVALPIDVPLIRRDAGSQNLGFLLGQVGASVILTSELCYKALPKNPNTEAIEFKGWPKVPWLVLEHLNKSPPKDWSPPNRISSESIAYIEYSCLKDGSVTGVAVTREQMLSHCQTLNVACQYTEGEIIVSVLDFKREFGLWHGIQSTILNGMHMLYVPYSVMKVNPSIWLSTITKHKASVALVKSRDMHWGLMAQREHKDISLLTLRMLLVADGANPWSLTSCDTFLDVFQSKGLKPESICPTAGSSETLTISIRR